MKKRPSHVHPDAHVTIERVNAFAEAPREIQLIALTELRKKVGDDSNDTQTSIMVAVFGVLAAGVIAPRIVATATPISNPWVAGIVIGLVAAVALGITVVPVVVNSVLQAGGRERANLWLRTYEAELERRWKVPGRQGRRWRSLH